MLLLTLREEIVCAVILIFLIFYYLINKVKDKEMIFLKMACASLLHVIFDVITVITVNSRDVVPDSVNRVLHICFYITGILYAIMFYHYVIHLCALYRHMRVMKIVGYIPLALFVPLLLFLPMEYVTGRGTDYSFGPLAFVGYGIFMLYCVVCVILLFVSRKRIESRAHRALFPIIIVQCGFIIAQALVPELLMTGNGVTLVCVGVFVALDNPDKDYKEQALWDFLTGLKNRNCYDRDLARHAYSRNHSNSRRIGFLVADMNYLKVINDNYGHVEGDKLIMAAANILQDNLASAEGVYRLGGDEFAALYLSPDDEAVAAEIEQVRAACAKAVDFPVPLSIAIGYASGGAGEDTDAVFQRADQLMYEDKTALKQKLAVPLPGNR